MTVNNSTNEHKTVSKTTKKSVVKVENNLPTSLAEKIEFKSTAAMRLWVRVSVTLDTTKITTIAQECGVDRNNWYNWLKRPGFLEWYDSEREKAMVLLRSQLDAIGLKQASKDFRYFKLMQKIAGRDVSEEPENQQPSFQLGVQTIIDNKKKEYGI